MAISMTEKQALIQQLLVAKNKAYQAEVALLLAGETDQADEVKNHGKELSRRIDRLIAQTMTDWTVAAEEIIEDVRGINKKVQRSIKEINNHVNAARNAVKLVGFIDDVVGIVDGIL